MQSVSGNSRVLDTLGLKSQVVAYDQSTNLLRAVEQLESRARHPLPVHPNVQVGAARGFTITSRSIPGACCTFAHSPAIPSHLPRPVARRWLLLIVRSTRTRCSSSAGRGLSRSSAFGVSGAFRSFLRDLRDPARFSFECQHRISVVVGGSPIKWSVGCGVAGERESCK